MNFFALLLSGAALLSQGAQADDKSMSTPVGGWNRAGLTDNSQELAVNYPYSLVDRGAQSGRRMIRGELAKAGKERGVHKLVVNGNPTPLYTDDDGVYARAYSFGSGSNSIEIRSPDGKSVKRVQFYEADRSRPQPMIRIIAAWDDSQAEVDLHVITPDGQHAFWSHPTLTNGGGLDVDTVDGPGPENFMMTSPMRGLYQVWINYWGNFSGDGYHFDEKTRQRPVITSRITLVFNENTARERREEFVVPLRGIGELTLVKTFKY
ncbi:YfaP family protein [Janthinobacterium sp. RB2R34]|uniref:YfaP family protein n=1 Tax=Janthinobacterium sp. RB2R34 TaxID=3424193 RepID=UPI003F27A174